MRYKKQAEAALKKPTSDQPHTDPTMKYRKALQNAHFASKERTEFFDEVYGDILVDLFVKWMHSEPHEQKTREYLYHVGQGLGFVNERLTSYETAGKNAEWMNQEVPKEETDG